MCVGDTRGEMKEMECCILQEYGLANFCEGMNVAFRHRSNKFIPFKDERVLDLVEQFHRGSNFIGIFRDQEMVGGLMFKIKDKGNAEINHVWIAPEYQGNGYAKKLLMDSEEYIRLAGGRFVYLAVANNYKPAYLLYKKCGYKKIGITANEPETYYFIDMIKPLTNQRYPNGKRLARYSFSWLKFHLLFDNHSTPNYIHRMIYR